MQGQCHDHDLCIYLVHMRYLRPKNSSLLFKGQNLPRTPTVGLAFRR